MASVKSNYIFNLLNTISGLLFPIITFPYVSRILMADGIGQVNFYLSVISYISTFSSLGIPIYAVRAIARTKDEVTERNKTALELLSLHAFFTLIGYLVVFILATSVSEMQENIPLFLLLSLNLIFTTIGCEWFFQGIEDFKYITIRGLIVKVVCVILLFLLVHDKSDLLYYGMYSVFGVVGGNIFNLYRLQKYVFPLRFRIRDLKPFKHFIPCSKILAINLISSVFLQLDTVMLGFMKGNASVGYYTAALKLTKMLMGITISLSVVLLPRFSSLVSSNDKEALYKLLSKSLDFTYSLSIPIVIGLIIMAPTLVYLFCGDSYYPSISTMRITAPIILTIGVSYLLCQYLFSLGKEMLSVYTAIISASVNFIINLTLIPLYEQDGAAFATLLAESGGMITYMILTHRFIKIKFCNRHLFNCLLGSFIMAVAIMSLYQFQLNEVVNAIIMPCTGACLYISVLLLLRDQQAKELILLAKNKFMSQ